MKIFVLLLILAIAISSGCTAQTPPSLIESSIQTPEAATPPTPVITTFTAGHPAHILRLDSYHPEYLWSIAVSEGVVQGLAANGYSLANGNIRLDYFYMDTKRHVDDVYFAAVADEAIAYIRAQQPDVVIASDNNAVRLVIQPLRDEGIPFVFIGLNDDPAIYGLADHPNITGVLERAHVAETFGWIELVFPEAERIVCLLDASVTTASYLPSVEAALNESKFANQSAIHLVATFEEWQDLVTTAAETSDVLVIGTYHTLHDAANQPVHEDEVMAWTVTNSPLPLVPFWEFSIEQGALGGSVISGDLQGYEAGRLAAQILNGAQAGDLPIVTPARGKLIVNHAAMAHWNVQIPLNLLEVSEIYQGAP